MFVEISEMVTAMWRYKFAWAKKPRLSCEGHLVGNGTGEECLAGYGGWSNKRFLFGVFYYKCTALLKICGNFVIDSISIFTCMVKNSIHTFWIASTSQVKDQRKYPPHRSYWCASPVAAGSEELDLGQVRRDAWQRQVQGEGGPS